MGLVSCNKDTKRQHTAFTSCVETDSPRRTAASTADQRCLKTDWPDSSSGQSPTDGGTKFIWLRPFETVAGALKECCALPSVWRASCGARPALLSWAAPAALARISRWCDCQSRSSLSIVYIISSRVFSLNKASEPHA